MILFLEQEKLLSSSIFKKNADYAVKEKKMLKYITDVIEISTDEENSDEGKKCEKWSVVLNQHNN